MVRLRWMKRINGGNVMYDKIVIGIDQSYQRCGISIAADGVLKSISSVSFDGCTCNSDKRRYLQRLLSDIYIKFHDRASELNVVIERIRIASDGFLSMNYIISTGALIAVIIDSAHDFNIPVFSVDTRSWKKQIVGTSKPEENSIGINPKKWPTIKYVISLGFESSILVPVSKAKKKGVVFRDEKRYTYNDDAADSACIALYGFLPENRCKLKREH